MVKAISAAGANNSLRMYKTEKGGHKIFDMFILQLHVFYFIIERKFLYIQKCLYLIHLWFEQSKKEIIYLKIIYSLVTKSIYVRILRIDSLYKTEGGFVNNFLLFDLKGTPYFKENMLRIFFF